MSLIAAADLAKSFGAVDIFTGVSLSIPRGARIALVGPNGIGKTTLLRVLVGLDEATSGTVQRARGLRIGYLPQEAGLEGRHTLWEECLLSLQDLLVMETELGRMEQAMSDPRQAGEVLERYGVLQHEFERLGGYTYETRVRLVLSGLGFEESDFYRPLPQLSGGQRTRVVLARLLLSNPDLLILDEPTNHLDMTAVEWLEGYLSQWEGGVLIVSHDRYFLDRVVDHVWEMGASGLEAYRGNYSAYVQQRQDRWDLQQKVFESEKERLLKELDYIKRNISGQRVSQAKGKLRRLSREVEAIESLGVQAVQSKKWAEVSSLADISEHTMGVEEVERRIRGLQAPRNRPPHLRLAMKSLLRSGDLVLRTRDLNIGYADEGRALFTAPDLVLLRGECAAVIGPNGAGKTTFLKTLLGQLAPLSGEVILGASLQIGYFAQAHEDLHPERTLVQEIEAVAPGMLLAAIRDYLARYLFTSEEVFKPVATLSGGERGRLALAKLALSQANLLLLDEPTNHLDIPAQEELQEVLADFSGTILLVSHDRYLIDALGTQIWEIDPVQSRLEVFAGSYSQYHATLEAQREEQTVRQAEVVHKARPADRPSQVERRKQKRLEEVEGLVATLEAQLDTLTRRLEKPPEDASKVQKLGEEYVRVQSELDGLLTEWEALQG